MLVGVGGSGSEPGMAYQRFVEAVADTCDRQRRVSPVISWRSTDAFRLSRKNLDNLADDNPKQAQGTGQKTSPLEADCWLQLPC